MKAMTVAVGQWRVVDERDVCLELAERSLREAAGAGASLCLLPEMFQTPYELPRMRSRAEPLDGPSLAHIRALARELRLHVVAGSICERRDGACYNTSVVIGPDGGDLGVHRKIHLFDVSLDTVRVRESSVLAAGSTPLVLELPDCRLGVCICYDARFPAVFRFFESHGVELVAIPAAFSQTTGAAHWHALLRARAVESQVYLAAACPAPNPRSSYVSYGHSLILDPWGTVLAEAGEDDVTIHAELTPERLAEVRRQLPLLAHRRPDLYREWETEGAPES